MLERSGAHVLAGIEIVANALIVTIRRTGAAPGRLAGVARVHPVRLAKPYLDHALALHKVPEAWAAIGGPANAGAGVKIAIIDSGIAQDIRLSRDRRCLSLPVSRSPIKRAILSIRTTR